MFSTARSDAAHNLQLRFRVRDSNTGYVIDNARPLAWVTRRGAKASKPSQASCENMVKGLLRTGVSKQSDAQLGGSYLITLNADHSVAILDPQVRLATSNLAALIPLKSAPSAWVLDEERGVLYVAMRDVPAIALIDLERRALRGYIATEHVANVLHRQYNDMYIWAGQSRSYSQLDAQTGAVKQTHATPSAVVAITSDAKGRHLMLGLQNGEAWLVETARGQVLRKFSAGAPVQQLAYSELSGAFYVADTKRKELLAVIPGAAGEPQRVSLALPNASAGNSITQVAVSPSGRHLMVLNAAAQMLSAFDTANLQRIKLLPTGAKPDQMAFTQKFIYVRNSGEPLISLAQLSALDDPGSASVLNIAVGTRAPNSVDPNGPFTPFATLPGESNGILIVNPADKVIYFYMEGMMVPKNSFKTFTAAPLGLLSYERGLRQRREQGLYEATVRLREGGTYDVAFFLDQPQIARCFELDHAGDGAREVLAKPRFEALFGGKVYPPDQAVKLRFALRDAKSGAAFARIDDLRVLSFARGGSWQARPVAKAVGDAFEIELTFPRAGQYHLSVEAPSIGLSFLDVRDQVITVK